MSRSRKHLPITGLTTAESEKQDKRDCNRATRRRNRSVSINDDTVFVLEREVRNTYCMAKDGKQYCPKHPEVKRK
jgi:hypothetical protein